MGQELAFLNSLGHICQIIFYVYRLIDCIDLGSSSLISFRQDSVVTHHMPCSLPSLAEAIAEADTPLFHSHLGGFRVFMTVA